MQFGLDTFVWSEPGGGAEVREERIARLLEEAELADQVGLHVFAVGEHHRPEYLASAPAILLAAIAARTKQIRLASAVTVLSSDDPVRVFQQFATIDLISKGRAEIIVGRGSFIESYPLFGYDLNDYDTLFSEKLDLLLKVRAETRVQWSGRHRAPLTGQGVYPRPVQDPLPVLLGVGGTPNSFVRAGTLGLPLVVAIIGGEPARFRGLVDMYRAAWLRAGHDPAGMSVRVHTMGFVGETTEAAVDAFYPGWAETMTKIGRERGWPPVTRMQFDAAIGPHGALMVGDPQTIADKALHIQNALGGVDGLTILMDGPHRPHDAMLRGIELLGTRVTDIVNAATAE